MRPAIEDGDVITVRRVPPASVAPGDIVLYRRLDRPIAHRVAAVVANAIGAVVVVPRGDGKRACDAPVAVEHILGIVVSIKRRTPSTIIDRISTRMARARTRWMRAA
jgi:hypothetical protein